MQRGLSKASYGLLRRKTQVRAREGTRQIEEENIQAISFFIFFAGAHKELSANGSTD